MDVRHCGAVWTYDAALAGLLAAHDPQREQTKRSDE
jgi:hypothetical protein